MGNTKTIEKKKEEGIFRRILAAEPSPLYLACQADDINHVRELLFTLKYSDLNRLESNGSTALHAASSSGHVDIVRLLLQERGVIRHRRDRSGRTAFEVAANDQIRQLFTRPGGTSNRFCNDDTDMNNKKQLLSVVCIDQQEDNNVNHGDDDSSKKWVDIMADENNIEGVQIVQTLGKSLFGSRLTRSLTFSVFNHLIDDQFSPYENEASVGDFLQNLIDTHVTPNHPEYDKACELVAKFARTKRIEPLLRLYTLETPFYRQLRYEPEVWLLPLVCHFINLKARFYQGTSYRGMSITSKQLSIYQSACARASRIIRTNTFCSTSCDYHVAEEFSTLHTDNEKFSVLMIFEFPRPCESAIQLGAISNKLPCLSDYEDEQEVLLLPQTLFRIKRIDDARDHQYITIWLEHLPPEQHPLRSFIQCLSKEIRKQ